MIDFTFEHLPLIVNFKGTKRIQRGGKITYALEKERPLHVWHLLAEQLLKVQDYWQQNMTAVNDLRCLFSDIYNNVVYHQIAFKIAYVSAFVFLKVKVNRRQIPVLHITLTWQNTVYTYSTL